MKKDPEVFISIVNWNGGEQVIECLSSLKKLEYSSFRIIVVDNASSDGSPERIKKEFPEVTLVENQENRGYSRANNQIIRLALVANEGLDPVIIQFGTRIHVQSVNARLGKIVVPHF